jgi:hypothetical protein
MKRLLRETFYLLILLAGGVVLLPVATFEAIYRRR